MALPGGSFRGAGSSIQLTRAKRKQSDEHEAELKRRRANDAELDEALVWAGFFADDLAREAAAADRTPTREDGTVGGARAVGNSTHLGNARYARNNQTKWTDRAHYGQGRQAQHLIPACLAKGQFASLASIIDDPQNGMMLPAHHRDNVAKKIGHIRTGHRDHATYTKNAKKLLVKVTAQLGCSHNTYRSVMDALRPVNKLPGYDVLDDVPLAAFQSSWNGLNPANQVAL